FPRRGCSSGSPRSRLGKRVPSPLGSSSCRRRTGGASFSQPARKGARLSRFVRQLGQVGFRCGELLFLALELLPFLALSGLDDPVPIGTVVPGVEVVFLFLDLRL